MKNKRCIFSIIFLICLTLAMVLIITPANSLFGSTTDWFDQHVNLADYIRNTLLQQKTLFPDYAFNLGAGQNIYNISYYGLFRIDVLIGCLISNVAMKDIIVTYMIINLILSVTLIYVWLRYHHFSNGLCILAAVLLLTSTVLFHSHRQIMFVDYMPALILALIAIDRYIKKGHSGLLIGSIVWMISNSYFFSVAGIVALFSYYCFRLKHFSWKNCLAFIKPVTIAIMISGVLLLPTAYALLENRKSGSSTPSLFSLLIPRGNIKGLLYDSYGCGLAYLSWIGLMLSLKLKSVRKLSIWLLLLIFIPLFSFGLNGFLYSRTKCLITFIPLIIYLTVYTLNEYHHQQIKLDIKLLILILLPLLVIDHNVIVLLDVIVALLGTILYLKLTKKAVYLLMVVPLLVSYQTNKQEEFVSTTTYQQISSKNGIKVDNDGRYDLLYHPLDSSNLANNNELRTSLYSSINNNLYNQFYYDIIKNPISIRNRVACLSNSNIFFQGMMGVKTIYSENVVPIGYRQIDENLYQNEDVLPIVYATSNSYDEKDFDQLSFPMTLDTIYNNVVVENGNSDYQSQIQSLNLKYLPVAQSDNLQIIAIKNGYRINSGGSSSLELEITQDLTNQILIIEFDLDKVKYSKTRDTSIKINGVTNKLSSTNAAYPNHNDHFTYILSQNEAIDKLELSFSSGRYDLKNIKLYTLDYDVIKNRGQEVAKLEGAYNQNGKIATGKIEVVQDGYLVTSLPYQDGYTVLIDGKVADNVCVNKAFIGTKITKGQHQIEIVFNAPLKKIGIAISGIGVILLLVEIKRSQNEKRINRVD